MPKLPEELDPAAWHRYFALEANNRAWDLSERDRAPHEDREMLSAAHAAAWHWKAVGTELHVMRALTLLARVHTLVGDGTRAVAYAATVQAFFLARETPAWERALVHAICAHAHHVASDPQAHRAAYEQAQVALKSITNDEDRKIVLATVERIPVPVS